MKKTIITSMALVLLAAGISLYSCKKETATQPQNPTNGLNVSVKEGRLVFKSVADYENTIDHLSKIGDANFEKWESEMGFSSMRKNLNAAELEKAGIVDPLLATLLNTEGAIQIENNIYKIDVPNESVKMIGASSYSNLNDFNAKNTVTYSTQDNVLDIVKGNTTMGRACNACPGQNKETNNYSASSGQISMKVVYQKAGIYYSLQSKIKKEGCISCPTVNINLAGSVTYEQCGSSGSWSYTHSTGGYGREYDWRAYSSSTRLKKIRFNVDFNIRDEYYSPTITSYAASLNISCN